MAIDGEADSAPSAEIEQNKCIGIACTVSGPANLRPDHCIQWTTNLGGWGARLSVQRALIINKLLTHGPGHSALSAAVNPVLKYAFRKSIM